MKALFLILLTTNLSFAQDTASGFETDAEILGIITDIQVLDNEIYGTTKNYRKDELEAEWYLSNYSSGEEIDGWYSSSMTYFSAHKQLTTTLTIDVALIALGCFVESVIVRPDDVFKGDVSGWVSAGGISVAGAFAYSSPGFNNLLSSDTEKAIISDVKEVIKAHARSYAHNMAIIFGLEPQSEKLVEKWAFDLAMSNYYQDNLYGDLHPLKKFNILQFLEDKGISVEKVKIIREFSKNYQQYLKDMKERATDLKNQEQIQKKQKEDYQNKLKMLQDLQKSIELREGSLTDPKQIKDLDSLKRKTIELKENFELSNGDNQ